MKGLLLGIVIAMFVPIFFFLGIGLVVAPFVGRKQFYWWLRNEYWHSDGKWR